MGFNYQPHIFDAGVLERILFECPTYEAPSIKHAHPNELARRMGQFIRNYDFHASMDFGAFEGSCTKEVRDIIENDILLALVSRLLGTENDKGLLYQAIFDRIKDKAHVSVKNALTGVILDMIKESGDRGTLVLNFLINLCLFMVNLSMILEPESQGKGNVGQSSIITDIFQMG